MSRWPIRIWCCHCCDAGLIHRPWAWPPKKLKIQTKINHIFFFNANKGVHWWLSGLRIPHCHCWGTGSIPGLGTSLCPGHWLPSKKKKKKKKKSKYNGLKLREGTMRSEVSTNPLTTVCWLTWMTSSPAWIFWDLSAGDYWKQTERWVLFFKPSFFLLLFLHLSFFRRKRAVEI